VTTTNPLWYTTRASGIVSLVLFTAVVVLGILVSVQWTNERWSSYLLQAMHRYISLLALVFLALHIVTAVIDPFAHLAVTDALVPFTSSYRPFWLGLGVVAVDIFIAVVVTSLLRARIGFMLWRVLHWLAYASWPIALVHGMGTGTDTRTFWGLGVDAICVSSVLVAVCIRVINRSHRSLPGAVFAPVVGIAMVWLGVWAVSGPLQTGWARVAGTPASLLASSTAKSTSAAPPSGVAASPSASPATASLPAGLNDELQGVQGQNNAGFGEVQFSDATNPSIGVTLSDPGDGSGNLLFTLSNHGSTLCSGTVSGQSERIATQCNGITVSLRIRGGDGGSIRAVLTTSAGGQ
jgi:sulfoxide reductase heme-binding subunit YedZ